MEVVFPLGLCSVGLIQDLDVWPEPYSVSEGLSALDRPFPCSPLDWPFLVGGLYRAPPRRAGWSPEPCGEPSWTQ